MKLKTSLIIFLIANQSFSQGTWDNSTISTKTTTGNVEIGASNINAKLNISNSTLSNGIRNTNSASLNTTQYGVYNYLATGTSTGTKYGIYSSLSGDSPNKYGIYSIVTNSGSNSSGTTPTTFGIYSRATGANTRAGYFYGDVENSNSNTICSASNGTKTILVGNAWASNDNSFSIAINQTDNNYDWDWTNSFILNRNGEMIKRINSANKAFSISRWDVGDVFRVYGDGTVYATRIYVKLASAFPDYVFEKNYKLKPLNEVEKFIQKNGHLSKMPTAQEVANEGVNVGEVTTILVEKVEELTLYMIQLQKEIEKLKEENLELKEIGK